MSSKSKIKGKTWENDVAKFLSSLYNESFIRVPHSGAYIGGKNSVRKEFLHEGQIRAMKGDIVPPSTWKKLNIECKSYAEFAFHNLYTSKVLQLEAWIEQLLSASDTNDLNILIFKITRKGKYIAVQSGLNWNLKISHTNYNSEKYGHWQIFDYDSFWKYNSEQVKLLSQ